MTSSPHHGGTGQKESFEEDIAIYPSGARAVEFKRDGSGFIYYPSGRVGVCKGVVNGRARYYMYGDDVRSTPLGSVNEHGVGFVLGEDGVRLALNKVIIACFGLVSQTTGEMVRVYDGVHWADCRAELMIG